MKPTLAYTGKLARLPKGDAIAQQILIPSPQGNRKPHGALNVRNCTLADLIEALMG